MMIKILLLIPLICGISFGKPYIGLQTVFSNKKISSAFIGKDYINESYLFPICYKDIMHRNSFSASIAIGFQFKKIHHFTPFIEGDYGYTAYKIKKEKIDFYEDAHNTDNILKSENLSIKGGHAFGVLVGGYLPFLYKCEAIIGLKLNMEQFKITASHTSFTTQIINPLNSAKNKRFIFSIEPILGLKHDISDKIFLRFTVGYALSQRQKIMSSYIYQTNLENLGIKSGVYIKPHALNIRVGIHYLF
jgi:hypothetical protein